MNEDFVPFELAKKLKEKGFREKCLAYYDAEDNVGLLYNTQYSDELLPCQYTDLLASYNSGEIVANLDTSDNCIDAPTISQVLKWLREEKELFIEVSVNSHTGFDFYFTIYEKGEEGWIVCGFDEEWYDTYEAAAIAGVECCLDNLI